MALASWSVQPVTFQIPVYAEAAHELTNTGFKECNAVRLNQLPCNPVISAQHQGGHVTESRARSSVWVREGGPQLRQLGGTADTSESTWADQTPSKFVWKRRGYAPSPESERPPYEKPLSARNQQVLMALIDQEHNAESVGRLMDAWRGELGMGSLVCILKELGRLKEHELMQQVFEWAKATPEECELQPQIGAYTTILAAYTRCSMMTSAHAVFDDMVARGIQPDLRVYNALLVGLARQGLVADAMALAKKVKTDGFQPNTTTYKELISACARGGSPADILRIFAEMREVGVRADYFTYRLALDAFARTVNWEGIIVLYEELVAQGHTPDRHVCTQILRAYEKKGLPERAEEVLGVMRAQNIPFTNLDYGKLILAYVKVGRLEEAEGVLQDMRARSIQPELFTYNTLLDGYGRQGRYEEAESVLADMKQVGVRPQPETFRNLMMAYVRGGHCRWAESVHSEMQQEGFAPTVVTYTMLIDAYGKAGALGDLLRLVEEMQGKKVSPNRATYNCLVAAYCKGGHFDLAKDVLLEMTTRGHMPDDSTYHGIVDAYCKGPIGDSVLGVYKEALRLGTPPSHNFSFALIAKLASERQYDKAERVFADDHTPPKRPAAYAECMLVYANHGMSGYADKLLRRVFPDGVTNPAVFNALITIAGREKRPAEVARLFTELEEKCGVIGYPTIVALLEGNAAQGAWEEVPRVVQLFYERCKREHGYLTQRAFVLIFEALSRAGKLAEMPAFYAEMNEARVRKALTCYSAILLGLKGRMHHPDAATVWEILEGFRLPVHKVIRNILSDRKQEGSWDLSLQQALERVPGAGARESLLHKRDFFNALLDLLWEENKRCHAANAVAVALRKGVYQPGRRALLVKSGSPLPGGSVTGHFEGAGMSPGEPNEWWLDLRHTSPGAACALLRGWLMGDAREGIAHMEATGAEMPEKVELYFGRTLEEGATCQEGAEPPHLASYLAVKALVAELGLPFEAVEGDSAVMIAGPSDLRRWILDSDGVDDLREEGSTSGAATGAAGVDQRVFTRAEGERGGGEQSDLPTSTTTVNGRPASGSVRRKAEGMDMAREAGRGGGGVGVSSDDGLRRPTAKRKSSLVAGTHSMLGDERRDEYDFAAHSLEEIANMLTTFDGASSLDSRNAGGPFKSELNDILGTRAVVRSSGKELVTLEDKLDRLEERRSPVEDCEEEASPSGSAAPFVRLSTKKETLESQ